MSLLMQIQETCQQFAEATSAALKIDVEVIDDDRVRIAGTGQAKLKIGSPIISDGIINRTLFDNKKRIIVQNPGAEDNCILCHRYGKCEYKKAVYSAIDHEDNTIGVIGVYAINDDQSKMIEYNNYAMLEFVEKIAHLIGAKVKAHQMLKEVKMYAELMKTVIDNFDKGVVILSKNHVIVSINKYLIDKLKIDCNDFISEKIYKLFPNFSFVEDEIKLTNGEYQELSLLINGKEIFFLCSIKAIRINNYEAEGYICLIEDFKDTTQMAYAISEKQNMITLDDIIGNDKNFIKFKEETKNVAIHNSTILLMGETGTGKELFARAIHYHSSRRQEPFVAINCGALPETLIESELFGYEKGAFTGANKLGKPGKFILANKGTLFLDEIETMPIYLQPKLLRVLERREVERIGGTKSISIDVRIVAATNVRLDEMVEKGLFREDLFHRLNVVSLFIPALRERGDDIQVLSEYFIKKYSCRFNKKVIGLTEEVKDIFINYRWKGNVRELQNTIEYAINMTSSDFINKNDLPYQFQTISNKRVIMTLEQIEKEHIKQALDIYGWNEEGRIEAAKHLGISRATIYRKIKELNS